MQKTYGYVRVSTKEQNEDRQLIALSEAGVEKKNIFIDKLSGKDFNRPEYKKMLRCVRKKDVIIIKSIDRLGRNYDEIIEQWRKITKKIEADIVVLDMPLLDTRRRENDLTGTFISDMVLQILSYVAQTERENIRQRQKEGIAAARMRGVRFGRPHKEIPQNFERLCMMWKEGGITSRKAADELSISQSTFIRWSKEYY